MGEIKMENAELTKQLDEVAKSKCEVREGCLDGVADGADKITVDLQPGSYLIEGSGLLVGNVEDDYNGQEFMFDMTLTVCLTVTEHQQAEKKEYL
jgi:hypothetical protein